MSSFPEVGARVGPDNGCAVVESVKAASDVYSPVTGEVVEVNEALDDSPESINETLIGDGWIFVVRSGRQVRTGRVAGSGRLRRVDRGSEEH